MIASSIRAYAVAVLFAVALPGKAQPYEAQEAPTAEEVRWRNVLIIGGGGLGVFLYGKQKWWNEGFTGNFRSESEGWFGRDTYAGGTDKLGHAWGTYLGTRALTRVLEYAGNDEARALRLAAWSALGAYTAIEVLDGYSKQYRFSKEDALANAAGAGLAVLLERSPALDRLLDLRLHYVPGPRSDFDPLGDYSGQTYLLVLKATGMPALRDEALLRYAEFALGYGARRFDDGSDLRPQRTRNLYFGVSLNLAALLDDTVFRDSARSDWTRRATQGALEVIQFPGTGIYAGRSF